MKTGNTNDGRTDNKAPKNYTDYNIFPGKIRLITSDGQKIVDRDEAIDMAHSSGMNLVQIGYNKNDFPKAVCKILDYGKYMYELHKKEKESRRKSREANAEAKEVQFSIRIDSGDLNTKINKIRSFITSDREKVKISIRLTRREMNLKDMAVAQMKDIVSRVIDISDLDTNPSFVGNIISCTIKPKK